MPLIYAPTSRRESTRRRTIFFGDNFAFGQVAMNILHARKKDSLHLPWLELDEAAGIDAPSGGAGVAAQVGHDRRQLALRDRLARIESVSDVDVPCLGPIMDEGGCAACHVGAQD